MKRFGRILRYIVIAVLVLALGAGGFGAWTVRKSFAQTSGDVTITGLNADVRVLRDGLDIPQIYATTDHDLFMAQGYVHAQDRFWEMDFRRHITAGRLSELFGESQVDTDKFLRTIGWRRVAEQEVALLQPSTRAYLQAYADGVNAYLKDRSGAALSLEYAILGLQVRGYVPEPWTMVDSLAWLKAMAWDLRGNFDDELGRAVAAEAVGQERTAELYPAYPFERHAPIVTQGGVKNYLQFDQNTAGRLNSTRTFTDIANLIRSLPASFGVKESGIGSNSWVVSGNLTTTGKPLLANDPHLTATMPGIWEQMGLHCESMTDDCTFDVAGWTFSGFPGVIIGHNAQVGWGFTNLGPDVTDFVLEDVQGDAYKYDNAMKPLTIVNETIKVAGGKDVQWQARATQHGPLISDASEDYAALGKKDGYSVALRWTALTPGNTADAVFTLDRARNFEMFRAAAEQFQVPSQNLLYTDVDGNIGYQSPGRIPIRTGYDGKYPVPGWSSKYDWIGYIPFDALPSIFNPRENFIVTANNAVIFDQTYPYFLTDDWAYGSRSQRIRDLITDAVQNGKKIDVATMQDFQMDARNELADIIVPTLVEVGGDHAAILKDWDGQMTVDSAEAALLAATWRNLLNDTFRDELSDSYAIDGQDRWFEVMRLLLADPSNLWWDDKRTSAVETRDDILTRALTEATAELTDRFGGGPATWRWGAMHTLTVQNQTFGLSGIKPIELLFNRGPVEVNGSSSVVNSTNWNADKGYEITSLPSMRQVLDPSNWDKSTWVNLTGSSGHAYSKHYVDQLDAWVNGTRYPWAFSKQAVEKAATETLVLKKG